MYFLQCHQFRISPFPSRDFVSFVVVKDWLLINDRDPEVEILNLLCQPA